MEPDHNGEALLDRKTLAKIHIARKDLCLDEDQYRDLLERITGVRTAREIRPDQLMALQREFRRIGWQGYLLRREEVPPLRYEDLGSSRPNRPNPRQLRMLEAMFKNIRGYADINPDQAFRGFLQKRFGVSDARFLDLGQFEKALKAVREMQARHGVKRPHHGGGDKRR
ncbi:MAG: regulatory protein GemA [Thermodesulfobacteriota bacterium]